MAAGTALLVSAARTASGNSGVLPIDFSQVAAADLLLNVTAAATEAGDTLDVYVQSSVDDGTTWNDFVHFTQVLGNGGAKKFHAKWVRGITPTTALGAPKDATLAAGVEQGPIGGDVRIKWVIVDAVTTGNQSFTFSVSGTLTNQAGR